MTWVEDVLDKAVPAIGLLPVATCYLDGSREPLQKMMLSRRGPLARGAIHENQDPRACNVCIQFYLRPLRLFC